MARHRLSTWHFPYHGVDSVCFYTYMYLSPIILSLQKLLCCSSVVLGVSFFVVLRTEHNLGVLIFYLLSACGLCSSDDGS
jgi:hypothetical protein